MKTTTRELNKMYGVSQNKTNVMGLGEWKLFDKLKFKDGSTKKLIHIEYRNMAIDLLRFIWNRENIKINNKSSNLIISKMAKKILKPTYKKQRLLFRLIKLIIDNPESALKVLLEFVDEKDKKRIAEIRNSDETKEWRIKVFRRDHFICQRCGNNKNIEAHHIKSFRNHLDLRFDINNGLTLCRQCHSKTESYGRRKVSK